MSILETLENNLRLDVYLDSKSEAHGFIYLDDGTTFDYRDECSKTVVSFIYDAIGNLSARRELEDSCTFEGAASKNIT